MLKQASAASFPIRSCSDVQAYSLILLEVRSPGNYRYVPPMLYYYILITIPHMLTKFWSENQKLKTVGRAAFLRLRAYWIELSSSGQGK
jgi:hypothetical protein